MANAYDTTIRLLCQGFVDDFAEIVAGDERMHDLMMELAEEFVEKYIPVISDEATIDVASELMMNITIRKV